MFRRLTTVLVVVALAAGHAAVWALPAQDDAAVLWRDPGEIEKLDFAGGPGGAQGEPSPPFSFVKESLAGSTAKIRVIDSHGVEWMVKFGEEVSAQTFASRVAWAAGYFAIPIYFIPSGTITGVTSLTRAAKYVKPDGGFIDASFERYLDSSVRWLADAQSWRWNTNPFVRTPQLNGLKILAMLLADWDNKDSRDIKHGSNTAILRYPTGEARYLVVDWGGSLGTVGSYLTRSKWNCVGFDRQTRDFVRMAHGNAIEWGYAGQHTGDFIDGIHLDDVRWILTYLGRISDVQLREGLLASGATPAAAQCFAQALSERIARLQALR